MGSLQVYSLGEDGFCRTEGGCSGGAQCRYAPLLSTSSRRSSIPPAPRWRCRMMVPSPPYFSSYSRSGRCPTEPRVWAVPTLWAPWVSTQCCLVLNMAPVSWLWVGCSRATPKGAKGAEGTKFPMTNCFHILFANEFSAGQSVRECMCVE